MREWYEAVLATLSPEQRRYIHDTKPHDGMTVRHDVVAMVWEAAVAAGMVWWCKP